jgi:hypothetical protein
MTERNKTRDRLVGAINRYLDDGTRKYTKADLAALGENDWINIKTTIADWEARGLARIVRPFDEAAPSDIVIEMLDYIDQKSPWPNWPVKPT